MGCEVAYLCRDGITYGPGPFGYSTKKRECCCHDNCLKADGTGNENIENIDKECPHVDEAFKAGGSRTSSQWLFVMCASLWPLLTAVHHL